MIGNWLSSALLTAKSTLLVGRVAEGCKLFPGNSWAPTWTACEATSSEGPPWAKTTSALTSLSILLDSK